MLDVMLEMRALFLQTALYTHLIKKENQSCISGVTSIPHSTPPKMNSQTKQGKLLCISVL